jgi:purine-nucleoside phosphorylase
LREEIERAVQEIRGVTKAEPAVAVILGTGLGGLAEALELEAEIPYEAIPGFPLSTVESHSGRLLFGRAGRQHVVAMQGRFHRYEGYTLREIAFPVRVMRALGAGTLVVSNACGGLHPLWAPGDLVLLADHINLLGDNPLIGPNDEALGPRFPDMSQPYDEGLRSIARRVARDLKLVLREGVYVGVTGPALSTAAEYRYLRGIGADIVGMSTVPEVIVAVHGGLRVLGLSVITDACLPDALEPVDVATIIQTAKDAEPQLTRLITGVLEQLP